MFKSLLIALFLLTPLTALAEVPGHVPEYDSKCPAGFQYSRDTISCKQADCPAGANRTYGYDCNCGEAWNRPFKTCMEGGLAVKCVAAGMPCDDTPVEAPISECQGEHKVKSGNFCVCELGYEIDGQVGGCRFVTTGAGLDSDDVEKLNDVIAGLDTKPNGLDTVEITIDGQTVNVGIGMNPHNMGTYRYTIDGIHYYDSLAQAVNPGFWNKTGTSLLNGSRRGLSIISPFNWVGSGYKGEDKNVKYRIGRQVIYNDIDTRRHPKLHSLKYMDDTLTGMAIYMDLRSSGKTAEQIAKGDQDIDEDIERVTSRLEVAIYGKKPLSDEDKTKLRTQYKKELYEAFEDGYRRYALYSEMTK